MTNLRQKRGWIWLVVIAMAAASAARAEDVRSHGVQAFASLVGHHDARASVSPNAPRFQQLVVAQSRAGLASGTRYNVLPGAWRAMLPVFFVGLLTPLILGAAPSSRKLLRSSTGSAGFERFQRPPPSRLV